MMQSGLADHQIMLAGKSYTLRFSIRAIAALQDHWGLPSFQAVEQRMAGFETEIGIDDLVGVLWAATRTHHRALSKDDILDLLDEAGFADVYGALLTALGNALPAPDPTPPAPAHQKKAKVKRTTAGA